MRKSSSAPEKGEKPGTGRKQSSNFHIIGIGASAGGLAALKTFFAQVPANSGLAFVVVVHLSPEHKSHLAELLQPHVRIPVRQVESTLKLAPDCVYVIPPNANLDTIDTHLRLSPLEAARRDRAPIDHFFRTLAATHDGDAIGIILTGTGSDGTLGIREIKQKGGLTLVQDPNEAEFDGMPQSAVATGLVDFVLPLADIPDAVMRYVKVRPDLPAVHEGEKVADEVMHLLREMFALLRSRTGRDFAHYKLSTIMRRIQRRMQLHQIKELSRYLAMLRGDTREVLTLADDLLITVTSFFRDPEVFNMLEQQVIPKLFEGKGPEDEVRVWSVGCSTGEEAYSVAILLLEEAERHAAPPRIQVFASDLHERSLQKAREGFFPGDIDTDVSSQRLKRFFNKENGGYRIRKDVREMVVFAPHNLLGDPPFSRLDLITCRNLMIYIQRERQRDIIELFHYALRSGGYLTLGTSETLEAGDLFKVEDKKSCVYRKRNVPAPEPRLPVFPMTHKRVSRESPRGQRQDEPLAYGMLHQRLAELYSPPSALVSRDDRVVHLSERVGCYFSHPGGEPSTSLFRILREELRVELRSALQAARKRGETVSSKPVPLPGGTEGRQVVMHVRPAGEQEHEGFALVIFEESSEEVAAGKAPHATRTPSGKGSDAGAEDQEAELDRLRLQLQAVIEEYENGQEEMKAANEEMQSTNEELRSTLEELETSKEELQSMNEELQTVNQENRLKVDELAQLTSDLQNLLAATDIATLFLDRDLRIMRFTPRIEELFNVRLTDRGRPLSDFSHRLASNELIHDARKVIERLIPIEREVRDEEERWYLTRLLPYRSTDDRIEGVVITFVDITNRKRTEEALRESEQRYRRLVEQAVVGVANLDFEGRLSFVNEGLCRILNCDERDLRGRHYRDWVDDAGGERLRERLQRMREDGASFVIEGRLQRQDGVEVWAQIYAAPITDARAGPESAVVIVTDITGRKHAEQALRESEEHLRVLVEANSQAVWEANAEGVVVKDSPSWRRFTGQDEEQWRRHGWIEAVHPQDRDFVETQWQEAVVAERKVDIEFRLRAPNGGWRWTNMRAAPLADGEGRTRKWVGMNLDVSDRMEAQLALRAADRRKEEFLATLAHELRNPLAPISNGLQLMRYARRDGCDLPVDEVQRMLERQTRQLVTLVDDLLDVSRITRGKLELHKCRISVQDVVESAVEASLPFIHETSQKLSIDMPPEPIRLLADPNRLAQIISNLLNNAAKYTPDEGEIGLEVRREGDWVRIAVRDTGKGIPREMQAGIFEMFGQLGQAQGEGEGRGKDGGGLGIGLSLARSLVQLHGGTIEVRSDGPDLGSEFTVCLPVMDDESAEVARVDAEAPKSREHSRRRVLIVDDNESAARTLAMLVRMMGHEVRTASDGREGVAVAEEYRPEIILMDIGMPQMDGFQAARAIRAQDWGTAPTLVALTGWGQERDRRRTQEAGFDLHLVKPADAEQLEALFARPLRSEPQA